MAEEAHTPTEGLVAWLKRRQQYCISIDEPAHAERYGQHIAQVACLIAALESARGAIEYLQPLWEKDILGAKVLTSLNAIDRALAQAKG